MTQWDDIAAAIGHATQARFTVASVIPLAGGDINRAFRLRGTDGVDYFVKLNDARRLAMFEAERAGLEALAATRTIRVPRPIACATSGEYAFLALEYLELKNSGNARQFGEKLAALHRSTAAQFGFTLDNTIGATSQHNHWTSDWLEFWREQRLGFQLQLAAHNGFGGALQDAGQELMDRLPDFFLEYRPTPSLLHGDLWGGNHAYLRDGAPVIFDPAPYYGDHEADIAMTELFGGFSAEFHAAYRAEFPLHAGYATRRTLYNLYHILNHANLFGGGYAHRAESMMHELLAQLR